MTKYLLISVRSTWVYHILNGDKTIELRKVIPNWALESVKKGETVKCLIYCTKAMPYLGFEYVDSDESGYCFSIQNNLDDFDILEHLLNGKIVAQFDLKTIEEITIDSYQCPYVIDDFDYDAKTDTLNYNDLLEMSEVAEIDFVNYEPKYAMYIDNLKIFNDTNIFDEPKNLSDYMNNFYQSGDTVIEHKPITRAPQNMMTVWGWE